MGCHLVELSAALEKGRDVSMVRACMLHTSAGSLDTDSGWWSSESYVQAFELQKSLFLFSLYVHRS